jgi:hypothetical protein
MRSGPKHQLAIACGGRSEVSRPRTPRCRRRCTSMWAPRKAKIRKYKLHRSPAGPDRAGPLSNSSSSSKKGHRPPSLRSKESTSYRTAQRFRAIPRFRASPRRTGSPACCSRASTKMATMVLMVVFVAREYGRRKADVLFRRYPRDDSSSPPVRSGSEDCPTPAAAKRD